MISSKINKKITIIGFLLVMLGIFTFLSLVSYEILPNGQLNGSGGHDSCYFTTNMSEDSNNIVGSENHYH